MRFIDRVRGWFNPEKPDPKTPDPVVPAPEPAPTPSKNPGAVDYVRAWLLFRKIPFSQLFPAITATVLVVFLAISGAVAWLAIFLGLALSIFKRTL